MTSRENPSSRLCFSLTMRSGECGRVVLLSAHRGAGVTSRSPASHTQNASHARAPGPQQGAAVLPRHEGEQHRGRTGEQPGRSVFDGGDRENGDNDVENWVSFLAVQAR